MEKNNIIQKCLDLFEKLFFYSNDFFSYSVLNVNSLERVSMNNQE